MHQLAAVELLDNFITFANSLRRFNIGYWMKFISELVSGKRWDIITQRILHQSFNKNFSNCGKKRIMSGMSFQQCSKPFHQQIEEYDSYTPDVPEKCSSPAEACAEQPFKTQFTDDCRCPWPSPRMKIKCGTDAQQYRH